MWLLLDNRDSFTHILHHSLLLAGAKDCRVVPSHKILLEELIALKPERLLISPGPETPAQAGVTLAAIEHFIKKIPVLGICLGHQALGMHLGARLLKAPQPLHGYTSAIHFGPENHPLFRNLPNPFQAMRYHSLVLEGLEGTGLKALARAADDNTLQVMTHESLPCTGIQFHPESVGTPEGVQLLRNWVEQRF